MSLFESLDPAEPAMPEALSSSSAKEDEALPMMASAPQSAMLKTFRDLLKHIMTIREDEAIKDSVRLSFVFRGTLLRPAHEIFPELNEAVQAHGYSLYMQQRDGFDEILMTEGILQARNISAPFWFHLGLLLATIVTTLVSAALWKGYTIDSIREALVTGNDLLLLQIYRQAREFAFPLLFILGVHEMGHYVAARLHGVKVTLPFFIPLPLWGSLGTLGAVIFIKSPFQNRKQLFDVGIAGPLAGLLVAVPLFLFGLEQTAETSLLPLRWLQGVNRVSVPPFLEFFASLVRNENQVSNLDRSVFYNHPISLAAWFGLLLTSLNLIPMGQLDGGHVAFALFGRRVAWPLAYAVVLGCVLVGLSAAFGTGAWPVWFILPLFASMTGLRHPPPHDDITPLGWPRTLLGAMLFIALPTMLVIAPFYSTLR